MAFPTGWSRKCAVTISSTYVNGTSHTDFPVLITEDMLPSEMFDADGSYPALSGGGDIRFSSDSAGSTQLACEVVSFVTDNNPANGSAEIWVKVPTLSGSTDTTIYVWYNKSGESQPAVTDTYGRNAVWSGFSAVYHMADDPSGGTLVDSTGSYPLTTYGSMAANDSVAAQIGNGIEFVGASNQYAQTDSSPATTWPYTLSCWTKYASTSGSGSLVFVGDKDSSNARLILAQSNANARLYYGNSGDLFGGTLSTSAFSHVVGVAGTNGSTTGTELYVDNVLVDSDAAQTGTAQSNFDRIAIGLWADSTPNGPFSGVIDEVRIATTNRSSDWIATEYNNQNSPATFATAGTPESVGGGAITGSIDASVAAVSSDVNGFITITGELASTLAAVESSINGNVSAPSSGSISSTVNSVVAALSGYVTHSGTIAGSVDAIVADINATVGPVGSLTATVDDIVAAITGNTSISGQIAAAVAAVTADINGNITVTGTIDAVVADIVSQINGAVAGPVSGEISAVVDDVTANLSGQLIVSGAISAVVAGVISNLNGTSLGATTLTTQDILNIKNAFKEALRSVLFVDKNS